MALDSNVSPVFINKALRKDIPSDAVVLTKKEALQIQWDTVHNWKPKTDTWPFTFGLAFLASVNGSTNLSITQHFRTKLQLGNYGRLTITLPTVIIPSVISVLSHQVYVTGPVLLGEDCPLCLQTRAALLQAGVGVGVSFITTPLAAFFLAKTYNTYDVPPLTIKNLPEIVGLWWKLTKRLRSTLPIIIGVNAISAAALTYFEADAFYSIQTSIYKREQKFKSMMAEGIEGQG